MNNIVSNKYTKEYKKLHENNKNYGQSSNNFLEELKLIIEYLKPKSILDYGCGKGILIDKIKELYPNIKCYKYDPSISGIDFIPIDKVDLIINTDVLEHIPENILKNVIEKISSISQNAFFILHHGPAAAILSNNENAHCTIKSPFYYEKLFKKYFDNVNLLQSKKNINSTAITFKITQDFIDKYNDILINYKTYKREAVNYNYYYMKKNFYKILYKITFNNIKTKFFNKYNKYKNKYKDKYKTNCNFDCNLWDSFLINNNLSTIRNFLENKNIAIVGNAESIFKKQNGRNIDEADIIIRMNRGYIRDKKSQGSKTTIWCGACANISEQIIKKEFNPEFLIYTDKNNNKIFESFDEKSDYLKEKLFCYDEKFHNELIYEKENKEKFQEKKPTTGCLMINFLIKEINFKSLSIYGFDFFETNNLYNKDNLEEIRNTRPHNFNYEKKYILDLVEKNKNKVKLY